MTVRETKKSWKVNGVKKTKKELQTFLRKKMCQTWSPMIFRMQTQRN